MKNVKQNTLLWVGCLTLAMLIPIFLMQYFSSVSLTTSGAQNIPYCYDVEPVGDGVGINPATNEPCYLTSAAARAGGAHAKDYCQDEAPLGDGIGYNSRTKSTCYFGTTPDGGGQAAVCGNATVEGTEQCDDGNTTDGDGCSAQCETEDQVAVCGNATVEGTEQCDDGNTTDGDGCSAQCETENGGEPSIDGVCSDVDPVGDGIGFNSTLNQECYLTAKAARAAGTNRKDYCKDVFPEGDGIGYNDHQNLECYLDADQDPTAVCGNATVEGTEQCDDGNTTDGDGCSAQCQNEFDTPTAPENVRAVSASPTEIVIEWDTLPVEGYNIDRDGQYYATVRDTTTFTDTDVNSGQIYAYQVSSFTNNQYSPKSEPSLKVQASDLVIDNSVPPAGNPSLPAALRDLYEPVFFDEFNGSQLNPSKWNTAFLWGPDVTINNEEQYYVDVNGEDQNIGVNPFSFDGSHLTISAQPTPAGLASSVNNQNYTSGIITSYDAFKFTHGYAEARVKIPKGQGLWPAFWLLNAYYVDGEKKPEIDIMENLGHQPTRAYQTYHHFTPNGQLVSVESHVDELDYSADYHVYSAQWEPGLIQFYIDGVPHNRIENDTVADEQMYVLANLAVGGNWPGSPDAQTTFPANYSIDWIRVYQKK